MSEDLDIRLCTLVAKHSAIYDMFDENFRNDDVKKEAWESVSRELGIPGSKCVIKWKGLKHRYVNCKRAEDSTWPLLPYLAFLDVVGEKSKGNKRKRKSTLFAARPAQDSPLGSRDQASRSGAPIIETFVAATASSTPSRRKSTRFGGEENKPQDVPVVEPEGTELVLIRGKKATQSSQRLKEAESASRSQPDVEPVPDQKRAKLDSNPVKRMPRGRRSIRFAEETGEPASEPESTKPVPTWVMSAPQTEVFRFVAQAKAPNKQQETPAAEPEDTELVLVRVKKTLDSFRLEGIESPSRSQLDLDPVPEPKVAKPASTPIKRVQRNRKSTRFAQETGEPDSEPEITKSVPTPVMIAPQTEVFRVATPVKTPKKQQEIPAVKPEDTELVLLRVKKTEQGSFSFVAEAVLADKSSQYRDPVSESEVAKPISSTKTNTTRGRKSMRRAVVPDKDPEPQPMQVDDLPDSEPVAMSRRIESNGGVKKTEDIRELTAADEKFTQSLGSKLAKLAPQLRGTVKATIMGVMDNALK